MGSGADPEFERLQLEIIALQVGRAAVTVDIGSRRVGVDRAIEMAQLEQHEFGVVVQLNAKPVPPGLEGFQLVSEPLVVHPGGSGYGGAVERAFHREERKGNVIGSFARAFGFLADAVFAIDDRRLARGEAERESHLLGDGREGLGRGAQVPLRFPVAVPDAALLEADTGDARAGAVQTLVVVELSGGDIGKRQVRQVQVIDAPGGLVVARPAALGLPEEYQLETKTAAIPATDVARVIPPLGAKLGMIEVVTRKFEPIAGQSLAVFGRSGEQRYCQSAPNGPRQKHSSTVSWRGGKRPRAAARCGGNTSGAPRRLRGARRRRCARRCCRAGNGCAWSKSNAGRSAPRTPEAVPAPTRRSPP